jgi:hypothetical protein
MDFAVNLLSLSTPTYAHDSGNHSDGYGHSNTALMWSLADRWKFASSTGLNMETVPENSEIYTNLYHFNVS